MSLFGLFVKKQELPSLDTEKVDGMAQDGSKLRLLLTDAIPWKDGSLPEKDHLIQLQKKINNYIAFYESGQYKSIYPDYEPDGAVIDIHFKYAVTDNCKKFLNAVRSQISGSGIEINIKQVI